MQAVYDILNQCLEIGRHFKIETIITNHLPTAGKDTRRVLNESSSITYFPHSASGRIKYLLEEYVGLDKKTIRYIKKQRSRWATVFRNYPQVCMLEHEVFLLHDDDEDEGEGEAAANDAKRTKGRGKENMLEKAENNTLI